MSMVVHISMQVEYSLRTFPALNVRLIFLEFSSCLCSSTCWAIFLLFWSSLIFAVPLRTAFSKSPTYSIYIHTRSDIYFFFQSEMKNWSSNRMGAGKYNHRFSSENVVVGSDEISHCRLYKLIYTGNIWISILCLQLLQDDSHI